MAVATTNPIVADDSKNAMKVLSIPISILGLLIGTRAMASAGVALLLADKLNKDRRRAVGWTMLITGVATTIPLAMSLFSKPDGAEELPVRQTPRKQSTEADQGDSWEPEQKEIIAVSY